MAAITGTADDSTQKNIREALNMKHDTLTVYVSPNRTNLRFSVKKVKKDFQLSELQWLIDILKEKGKDAPKTMIFCNTMNEIASVANHLLLKLGVHAYDHKIKSPENCLLSIYHSNTWQTSKDRILASLKGNGLEQIVVYTTALCMGVNFPDIQYVIIWGGACSILDLHQEAGRPGRPGRDGLLSHVIVLYHGQPIGPSEQEVKDFVRAQGCLQVAAYKTLDSTIIPLDPLHDCYNYCSAFCNCKGTSCSACALSFESETSKVIEKPEGHTHNVTAKDQQDLRSALEEVFEEMKLQSLAIDESASHGFSTKLIDEVAKNCDGIFTIEDVLAHYPVFSVGNAIRILEVIQELFLHILSLEDTALFNLESHFSHDTWFNFADITFSDSDDDCQV